MDQKPIKFVPSGGNPQNSIASVLKTLAYVTFGGGFIGGIVVGNTVVTLSNIIAGETDEFQFGLALSVWFGAFVLGMLLLGFSELLSIQQLQQTQAYIPCAYDPQTDTPQPNEPETPAAVSGAEADASPASHPTGGNAFREILK